MRVELNIRASQLQEVLEVLGGSGGDVEFVINITEDKPQRQTSQGNMSDFDDVLEPDSRNKQL